ncbi:maleylpyruvate isomerase family mycothiol-dependent enzyme [Pseudonocardia acaciae]|uniref:maleylpyruvate isomerase family mycothiol-dependent enzyme n=1 Tax=Pseudonocardia acaciae TaxID=551276 RepID=UPI00049165E9|nr:maleylpyruvate isomerase family mycothiol-dependent enzyme [Pseudonocardia acaciae]
MKIDRDAVVGNLGAEWASISELLGGLSAQDWKAPSVLPGWSVQDIVAHMIGTESWLDGQDPPEPGLDPMSLPHVRNEIAARNERWVLSIRPDDPARVLDRFREITDRRLAALRAMSDEEFHRPSWTPAGEDTYARFMRIRVFDCWLHEQDIRATLDLPGHEDGPVAEMALDEVAGAIGFLIGKRAGAPDGSAVALRLTGPVRREYHVEVDGRAKVVDPPSRPATTTVSMTSSLFTRLTGGRVDPASRLTEVELAGDPDLGRRIALNLAFTI